MNQLPQGSTASCSTSSSSVGAMRTSYSLHFSRISSVGATRTSYGSHRISVGATRTSYGLHFISVGATRTSYGLHFSSTSSGSRTLPSRDPLHITTNATRPLSASSAASSPSPAPTHSGKPRPRPWPSVICQADNSNGNRNEWNSFDEDDWDENGDDWYRPPMRNSVPSNLGQDRVSNQSISKSSQATEGNFGEQQLDRLRAFMSSVSTGMSGGNPELNRVAPGMIRGGVKPGGPWDLPLMKADSTKGQDLKKEKNWAAMSMDSLSEFPKLARKKEKPIDFSNTDWDWGGWDQDWDPMENLDDDELEEIADRTEERFREQSGDAPRDKWITPLLDFRSVFGAVDPDQDRTEEEIIGEALANQDESLTALRFVGTLIALPLAVGFIASRSLAQPVTNFVLRNNKEAFAMTDMQKVEGAQAVHIEETRLRLDIAIGRAPPLSEEEMSEHLRENAKEIEEEERHNNQKNLITIVADTVSTILFFSLLAPRSRGRRALSNTLSRLFEGLSDIAKAVLIILVADTLLGYHSEEGWTGLIELVLGHYGIEAEEESVVIFVGTIPVIIDVFFKYWIFVGLNRISPGAVVTIKQIGGG